MNTIHKHTRDLENRPDDTLGFQETRKTAVNPPNPSRAQSEDPLVHTSHEPLFGLQISNPKSHQSQHTKNLCISNSGTSDHTTRFPYVIELATQNLQLDRPRTAHSAYMACTSPKNPPNTKRPALASGDLCRSTRNISTRRISLVRDPHPEPIHHHVQSWTPIEPLSRFIKARNMGSAWYGIFRPEVGS